MERSRYFFFRHAPKKRTQFLGQLKRFPVRRFLRLGREVPAQQHLLGPAEGVPLNGRHGRQHELKQAFLEGDIQRLRIGDRPAIFPNKKGGQAHIHD